MKKTFTTKSEGIQCEKIYTTVSDFPAIRNQFTYKEQLEFHFDSIQGFAEDEGKVFPAIDLFILDKNNDTLVTKNILDGKQAYRPSLLKLTVKHILEDPLHTGNAYTMNIIVKDTKGPGVFFTEFPFEIIKNEHINTKETLVKYKEIYLFQKEWNGNEVTVHPKRVMSGQEIYLAIIDAKGFSEQNGQTTLKFLLKAKDASGKEILNFPLDNFTIDSRMVQSRLYVNFSLPGGHQNPISLDIAINDVNSGAKIEAKVDLNVR
ncbi:hypothetical protein [Aquimarina mytili]|uniref:Uncharacterized protein n=1 Tax=Aquimarina mytili TaxID=874423 RepID=A0A936ZZT3_9FLAO|nr:hypothetical protein [Aquimarina mytili]MBL0684915.1 hypothetical protein [Aquimarina mytili]